MPETCIKPRCECILSATFSRRARAREALRASLSPTLCDTTQQRHCCAMPDAAGASLSGLVQRTEGATSTPT